MKILGIETSTPMFSLCVNEDDKTLYEINKNRTTAKNRDGEFFVEAKKLLDYFQDERVEVVCVSIGPGMFTSLRVGLALAKGLALAHNIPVVGVNTLDVIGIPASFMPYPIFAVINAYHGEVYAAIYNQGRRITDYLLITPQEIHKYIKGKTIAVGPGVEVCEGAMSPNNKLDFRPEDMFSPSASKVVTMALPRIHSRDYDAIENLEPFYMKRTDAERNYHKTDAV